MSQKVKRVYLLNRQVRVLISGQLNCVIHSLKALNKTISSRYGIWFVTLTLDSSTNNASSFGDFVRKLVFFCFLNFQVKITSVKFCFEIEWFCLLSFEQPDLLQAWKRAGDFESAKTFVIIWALKVSFLKTWILIEFNLPLIATFFLW